MGMTLACLFTLALPEAGQDPFFYAMVVPTQQKSHSCSHAAKKHGFLTIYKPCSVQLQIWRDTRPISVAKIRLICTCAEEESLGLYEVREVQIP